MGVTQAVARGDAVPLRRSPVDDKDRGNGFSSANSSTLCRV